MTSIFLPHPAGRIHVLRFGHGPNLLIALHGFNDRARMFAVLESALAEQYTVVAIDCPFHGQTEWSKKTFTKEDLLSIVRQIVEDEGKERFSLMGFSFGARLAQAMLPELAGQLDRLYLLSPDGVKTQGMSIATYTPVWLRHLLRSILQSPNWFIQMVRWGRHMRIVSPFTYHFLTNNLNRPERLRRTFGCWLAMSSFYLRRRRIKSILQKSQIPTEVYIGLDDPLLHQAALKKQYEGMPSVQVFWLEGGHRLVGEELAQRLAAGQ